jgi:multicomponent Na+:H+ antiporter subunit G
MIAFVADVLSWLCMIGGAAVIIISAYGMIRLPDVFSRMHSSGIIDTLGIALVMLGLVLQAGFTLVAVKLGLIFLFVLFTSPATTHALARAALADGQKPQLTEPENEGGEPSKR